MFQLKTIFAGIESIEGEMVLNRMCDFVENCLEVLIWFAGVEHAVLHLHRSA